MDLDTERVKVAVIQEPDKNKRYRMVAFVAPFAIVEEVHALEDVK